MICRRCLRKGLSLRATSFLSNPIRNFSASTTRHDPSPTPEVRSPSSTTPLSSPISPPGVPLSKVISNASAKKSTFPTSVAPAGTKLNGLNYVKGRDDPVALDEAEYPEWLWHVLDVVAKEGAAGDATGGDEFSKSKKQRRMAAKAQRKLEARLLAAGDTEALEPKVPIQHQTIDLPSNPDGTAEGALEAVVAREELRSAMRGERRKNIKESNYLKGMK